MSWLDRVRGEIDLISPDGKAFKAKWVGDTRSIEKNLGIFDYPKVNGQVVQDLGVGSTVYPLTLYFDGDDNDIESSRFFGALSAKGKWVVFHPTKGRLSLQLISAKESIEPVVSGSVTVIKTEWVTSINETKSAQQLSAAIKVQNEIVAAASLDQFTSIAKQESVSDISAIKSAANLSLSLMDSAFSALEGFEQASSSIRRGISDSLNMSPIDLTVLGGQIQSIMSLPAKISGDVLSAIRPVKYFIDKMIALPDNVADQTYLNVVAIRELFLTSANSSIAVSSTIGSVSTRSESVEVSLTASNEFKEITDFLDSDQELFSNNIIEKQYFSQSSSFIESTILTAMAIRYLNKQSFDLAVEKVIVLDRERSPIEIAISEYGDDDIERSIELFIRSNKITGNDIIVIPAGREVSIYV